MPSSALKKKKRHSGVHQSAEKHVAADDGETIQVSNSHKSKTRTTEEISREYDRYASSPVAKECSLVTPKLDDREGRSAPSNRCPLNALLESLFSSSI